MFIFRFEVEKSKGKQITRHYGLPGNQTTVKTFERGKTENELQWCEKANIYIQIAV